MSSAMGVVKQRKGCKKKAEANLSCGSQDDAGAVGAWQGEVSGEGQESEIQGSGKQQSLVMLTTTYLCCLLLCLWN